MSKIKKVSVAYGKKCPECNKKIDQALHFCENLMMEGKEVYFVDMQDKDPSEMGFKNFTKLIQKTLQTKRNRKRTSRFHSFPTMDWWWTRSLHRSS